MLKRSIWSWAAVILLAHTAGCGSSDDATTVQNVDADERHATEALLTAEDLGPDWSEVEPEDEADDEQTSDEGFADSFTELAPTLPACSDWVEYAEERDLPLSDITSDAPVSVEGSMLTLGPSQIEQQISVHPSTQDAHDRFELAGQLRVTECVSAVMEALLANNLSAEAPGVSVTDSKRTDNAVGLGDDETGTTLTFTLEATDGSTATGVVALHVLRIGRMNNILTIVTLEGSGVDIDEVVTTAFTKADGVFGDER